MSGVFQQGDVCSGYRVVKLISAGGMGEVFEAVHQFTERRVALKCLQLRHTDRADLKERMRLEAIVLCKIQHPNVVMVYDAGVTDNGMVWIAMELLRGRTLREILCSQIRIPIRDALAHTCKIAEGVEAAHVLEVVHRDLKPENVLVTDKGEVKVLDLGTAKFYGYGLKNTDRLRTVGTPAYMAPEHLRGQVVDVRADIYSLGLIAYELIAGHHPFATVADLSDVYAMGAMQLHGDVPPLPSVQPECPPQAWEVIGKALAKNRDDRPRSMAEFAASLKAVLRAMSAANPGSGEDADGGRLATEVLSEYLVSTPAGSAGAMLSYPIQECTPIPASAKSGRPTSKHGQVATLEPMSSAPAGIPRTLSTVTHALGLGAAAGLVFALVSFFGWKTTHPSHSDALLRGASRIQIPVVAPAAPSKDGRATAPKPQEKETTPIPDAPPVASVEPKRPEVPTAERVAPGRPAVPARPTKAVNPPPPPRRTAPAVDLGAPKF